MSRTDIRCAVIGLGRIGSTLEDDPRREKPASHAGAITANPECVLVGGSDPDPAKREAFSKRWGGVPVFETSDDLIARTKPRIVHIAAPPEAHGRILAEVIRHKVQVVICEKPLAPTAAEGRRMVAKAERSGVKLVVNHERRFASDWRTVREWIDTRRFGSLQSIHGQICMGSHRGALEVLLDDGTHFIDVLRFVTRSEAKVEAAWGDGTTVGGVMGVALRMGKTAVTVEIGGGRDHIIFEAAFSFARGRVRCGNGVFTVEESFPSPHYSGAKSLSPLAHDGFPVTGYFANMLAHGVTLVRKPKTPVESGGREGLAALKVIEAIGRRLGRPVR